MIFQHQHRSLVNKPRLRKRRYCRQAALIVIRRVGEYEGIRAGKAPDRAIQCQAMHAAARFESHAFEVLGDDRCRRAIAFDEVSLAVAAAQRLDAQRARPRIDVQHSRVVRAEGVQHVEDRAPHQVGRRTHARPSGSPRLRRAQQRPPACGARDHAHGGMVVGRGSSVVGATRRLQGNVPFPRVAWTSVRAVVVMERCATRA